MCRPGEVTAEDTEQDRPQVTVDGWEAGEPVADADGEQ